MNYPEDIPHSKIPTNLNEAIERLDLNLDKETKEKIVYYATTPYDQLNGYEQLEESGYGHHGIGMSIRNNWYLWENSKLNRWAFWTGQGGIPDTTSRWIIKVLVWIIKKSLKLTKYNKTFENISERSAIRNSSI